MKKYTVVELVDGMERVYISTDDLAEAKFAIRSLWDAGIEADMIMK